MLMLLWATWGLMACQVVVVEPTPTLEPEVLVPLTPTPVPPTPQPTAPVPPAETTPTFTLPPAADTTPRVTAVEADVNLRTGPGLVYDTAGILPVGESLEIIGRSFDATWWLVSTPNGYFWVAAGVVRATNVERGVPVALAPPTPTPTPGGSVSVPSTSTATLPAGPTPIPAPTSTPVPATPVPPTATPVPQFQYTIRNIFGQVNEAITQIRGDIRDRNNNPVSGVRVRVRSGSFCTVSYPSGPPGGYPNGNYDILLDNRAKDGSSSPFTRCKRVLEPSQ
jgi:uncharacterized protein YraI